MSYDRCLCRRGTRLAAAFATMMRRECRTRSFDVRHFDGMPLSRVGVNTMSNSRRGIVRPGLLFASGYARAYRRVALSAVAALIAFNSSSSLVHAAPINYGSFMGTSVIYDMVVEAANTVGDTEPLFGPPTTLGPVTPGFPAVPCVMCGIPANTLDFSPVGFSASTIGGGVDQTDGNLAFMILAKPGQGISNISFKEAGDVSLTGIAPAATETTFAAVTSNVFIDIVEVNGVGITPINLMFDQTFSPSGGTYGLGTDGFATQPLYNDAWTGSLFVDIQQELIDRGINGVATKVSVDLDNTLSAISQNGTAALIAKKDHGVIITTNVPEPASCLLAVLGLVSLLGIRRGRN
jgi:hypothetical protein